MKNTLNHLTRILALAVALLTALPAHAVLRDHGPADPVLVWPQWYRDLNGTALGLCKSQILDAAIGAEYCFPIEPNPLGFAGNVGDEIFYSHLFVNVVGNATPGLAAFELAYEAALEAAYIPGPNPTHGEEVVFSRLRFLMHNTPAGTYTVTHPYGIQVFPDVARAGKRSVFFTIDLPPGIPGDFAGALKANMGPFPQTADLITNLDGTVTAVPKLLTLTDSATGVTHTFLGDGNTAVPFVGSPFGTNFVRVDGPVGSAIGGINPDGTTIDFIEQHLGAVLGQVWTANIPTPFQVQRAVYHRSADYNSVDVWAQGAPGSKLIATGVGIATTQLAELPGGTGQYYAHVQQSSAGAPPAVITVTNYSNNPATAQQIGVADQVTATAAWDLTTRTLTVAAQSSDQSGPNMIVVGPFGGDMIAGASGAAVYTSLAFPADVAPPRDVTVQSDAGGNFTAAVAIGQVAGVNVDALLAGNDSLLDDVPGAGATTIDVALNDSVNLARAGVIVRIVSPPANGTAAGSTGTGLVTYTPRAGTSGFDSFSYILEDSLGGFSNEATVDFNVVFTAPPPVAGNDAFAFRTSATVAKLLSVYANDTAAAGTTLNKLGTVLGGTNAAKASLNAAGEVSYLSSTTGLQTFTYQVPNDALPTGTLSNVATVSMVGFNVNQTISLTRADYTTNGRTWNVRGSTNWFNAALTQSRMTCWVGTATAPTAATLIGSGPIDTAGAFAIVTASPGPAPLNTRVSCQSNQSGTIGTLASRNR